MDKDILDDYDDGLYIPVNVRRRKEIVEGFGKKEALITAIGVIIGAIIGFLIYISKNKDMFYLIISPSIAGIVVFTFTRKDRTNRSTVDILKAQYDFFKGQKFYKYKYVNPLKK